MTDQVVQQQLDMQIFENPRCVNLIIQPKDGQILRVNSAACEYYGYNKDRLMHMKITEINTLPRDKVFMEMENAKLEKRNFFNFKHKLGSGEIRDVEVHSGPIIMDGQRVLYSMIHDISERKRVEAQKEKQIKALKQALVRKEASSKFIPICSSCKQIRCEDGGWCQVEAYFSQHFSAQFTHCLCPDCVQKLYPQLKK